MILSAARTASRTLPRATTIAKRAGVAFENKFFRALRDSAGPKGVVIERNPWFAYLSSSRALEPVAPAKFCSPDLLIIDSEFGFIIVVEVKYTWVPDAISKLRELYCPVVAKALKLPTHPLVVCKRLVAESPRPQPTLGFAFQALDPLFQWLGREPIRW